MLALAAGGRRRAWSLALWTCRKKFDTLVKVWNTARLLISVRTGLIVFSKERGAEVENFFEGCKKLKVVLPKSLETKLEEGGAAAANDGGSNAEDDEADERARHTGAPAVCARRTGAPAT